MVATVTVDIFLGSEVRASFYGVKESLKIDYLKSALWNIHGWNEGTFRFQTLASGTPVDSSQTIGAITPLPSNPNEPPSVRLEVVPGANFVR